MAWRLDGAKPLTEPMLNIVNWTLRNKLQWNVNGNSNIFIEENTFENVICKKMSLSSWPQCVNKKHVSLLTWCPHMRLWAAIMTDFIPDAQTLLIVVQGVLCSRPANSAACRVGAWPSMAWHTLPMYTSWMALGSIPGKYSKTNRVCHSGGQNWDYYPGTLNLKLSHSNLFEDWAPIDFFKWVAET